MWWPLSAPIQSGKYPVLHRIARRKAAHSNEPYFCYKSEYSGNPIREIEVLRRLTEYTRKGCACRAKYLSMGYSLSRDAGSLTPGYGGEYDARRTRLIIESTTW
jgi:hypothetical protein